LGSIRQRGAPPSTARGAIISQVPGAPLTSTGSVTLCAHAGANVRTDAMSDKTQDFIRHPPKSRANTTPKKKPATIPQAMLPLRGEASWMTGSPDRMAIPSALWDLSIEEVLDSNEAWGMEAKTARNLDGWGESGTDIIPIYYMTQCVWYMAITKKQRWDLAVYFPFYDDFRHYRIERNLDIEADIVGRVTEWRERHIVGGEMPQIDGSEGAAKYLLETYRVPKLPDREATAEEVRLALELREVRRTLDGAKERYELLSAQMKALIGEYRGIRGSTFGSILWSPVAGRATAKLKEMEKQYPELYTKLIGEGIINIGKPSRQFRPSFGKEE